MTHREILEQLREPTKQLHDRIPSVFDGYRSLHRAAFTDGALDAKTKELIALAIGVAKQCDGCIASHARGAARHGATAEEVADVIGVAIIMDGGPGMVYGPRAMEAFLEFNRG